MRLFLKLRLLAFLVVVALSLSVGFFIPPSSAAGNGEEEVLLFSADRIIFDRERKEVTILGHVELTHDGYQLNANTVLYDENAGTVHAIGNVRIKEPNGSVLYLDEAMLSDDLVEGFIVNLRFIFEDGSRVAARDGERVNDNLTILNYAVFTPCKICDDHPGVPPSWRIKAVRITHNQEKRRIYYKNATLEIFGLPVAYLPYMSHPDPSVDRASGFLTPEIDVRRELGVVLRIPYYFAISPSMDATFTPIITTKEGPVLSGEFRKHLGFGQFTTQGSIAFTDERDDLNIKTGEKVLRGHFFGYSQFRHSDNVRTNIQLQFTSDDTYLRLYKFSNVDTLISKYQTEAFDGRSYYSVQALWFQGLRAEDVSGLTGIPLPLINLNYVSQPSNFGSVFRFSMNGLALHRTDGMDTRRLILQGSWSVPYTTSLGQVLELSFHARADVYDVSDAARPDSLFFGGVDGTYTRFLPSIVASFRWPFVKTSGKGIQQIIEPVVRLVVAPNGGNPEGLPNEDSRTFELTDTNILALNRLPGLDRWEGGTRINYGLRWMLIASKVNLEALVAQSYRFEVAGTHPEDIFFSPGSGLSGKESDIVTHFAITVNKYVQLVHNMRFDKDTLQIRRNEIDTRLYLLNTTVGVRYYKLARMRDIEELFDREEIKIYGNLKIKKNWQIFGDITRNLTSVGNTISQGIGIFYGDCCIELSLSWRRSFTTDRDIIPGNSIHFKISLKHLG